MSIAAPTGAETETAPIPDDVRAWILDNPTAILTDPDVMRALVAPAEDAGRNVIDLRGALIARLERQLGRLAEAHRDVIAAAWDNLSGMEQVHRAALAVLDAQSFDDFLAVVASDFRTLLKVDVTTLAVNGELRRDAGGGDASVIAAPDGALDRLLAPGVVVTLIGDTPGDPFLFGDAAARVRSTALIRLDFGPAIDPGLLAFGAEDPARFEPEQGADLLTFLGGVVQRAMRDWLALGR